MRQSLIVVLILIAGCSLVGYEEQILNVSAGDAGASGTRDGAIAMDGALQSLPDGSAGASEKDAGILGDGGASANPGKDAQVEIDSGPRGTECQTADCRLDCPAGATDCKLDCREALTCTAQCAVSGNCSLDCRDATRCDVTCALGTDCSINCRGVEDCRPTCAAGSECTVDCREGANCDKIMCAAGASCTIKCDRGDDDCGFALCPGQKVCPDGEHHVCNANCP